MLTIRVGLLAISTVRPIISTISSENGSGVGSGVDVGSGVGIGVGMGVEVGFGVSAGAIVTVGGIVRSSSESESEHATIVVTIASNKKMETDLVLFRVMFSKLVNQVSLAVIQSTLLNIYDVFQCG